MKDGSRRTDSVGRRSLLRSDEVASDAPVPPPCAPWTAHPLSYTLAAPIEKVIPLLLIAASTLVGIAGFAGLLHLIPRLGAAGTRIGAWLCRAPGLDLVVSLFTWIPPTVLGIVFGWRGVVGAIIGQVLGMLVWMFAHELANRKRDGPRLVTFLNRTVGRLNNHVSLWVNALAVPVFIILRVAELCVYPILTPLVGLPRYRHGEWV